jgi:osmotically-inducible protein OsmY
MRNVGTIQVEIHNGTAILRGTVPSQSAKWRCVDCCRHVAGILNVIDHLVVLPA